VARGIITALADVKPQVPMIVRLVGTNAEQGRQILSNANMTIADTLFSAAQMAVNAVKGS
jgi:succinyl-CoA synthetase beta subunit